MKNETRLFIAASVFLIGSMPLRANESGANVTRWEYATLTMLQSQSLVNNHRNNHSQVYIYFDSEDLPNRIYSGKEWGGDFVSAGKEELYKELPDLSEPSRDFYKKLTGKEYPENYKEKRSEVPILNAIGERGWELVTVVRERSEVNGISKQLERTFYFRRLKR